MNTLTVVNVNTLTVVNVNTHTVVTVNTHTVVTAAILESTRNTEHRYTSHTGPGVHCGKRHRPGTHPGTDRCTRTLEGQSGRASSMIDGLTAGLTAALHVDVPQLELGLPAGSVSLGLPEFPGSVRLSAPRHA